MTSIMDTDFLFEKDVFVRVYRLPEKLTNGFCFGKFVPITFGNVDWFNCKEKMSPDELAAYVRKKSYYDPDERYLLLSDVPQLTFMLTGKGEIKNASVSGADSKGGAS